MPILKISNIAKAGVNSDVSPWELGPEFLTSGINFRIVNDKIRSFGGYSTWSTAPIALYPGLMMPVSTVSADYWLVAGRTNVYVFDGSTWSNINNAAGYAGMGADDELNWTGCMLGKIPIINNPQHYPEYWSPQSTGQAMQFLQFDAGNTWQAMGYSCAVMRSHKQFLIALNLTEGVSEIPDGVRWSHPADINGLPYTWDETVPTNLAGKTALGGDSGQIIDGQSLRDSFVVYSESGINTMDLTGDSFVFRIREMSSTIGLLNKRCIAEVKGLHFFLGDGDIVVNDGHKIQSLIHKKLRRRLVADMSADYYNRSFVINSKVTKEVWFCVPENNSAYPNIAYIYNWRDDTWAIRDLPLLTHASYGPRAVPTTTWDNWDGTWDEQEGVWGSRKRSPLDDFAMGCTPDHKLLQLDEVVENEAAVSSVIERTDFPLEGHDNVTTITRLYPHMEGTQPVQIELGSQRYAGGPIQWKPAVTFTPGMDRKVDVRSTGELHAWRVSSTSPGNWTFSGVDIEYQVDGVR